MFTWQQLIPVTFRCSILMRLNLVYRFLLFKYIIINISLTIIKKQLLKNYNMIIFIEIDS